MKITKDVAGIVVTFPYNPLLVEKVKTIPGHRWHPEKKYWSFPDNDRTLEKILEVFKEEKIHIDPALQAKIPAPVIARDKVPKQSQINPSLAKRGEGRFSDKKLSITTFEDLKRELLSRKYSYRTLKGYLYYNRNFLSFIGKSPSEITDNDIKDYLIYLAEEKQAATSTLNQAINALKFYYGSMLKKKFVYEIKRPRKDRKLPVVLSREEVAGIISSLENIKHKAILMLIYSAGLRVGELVRLRPEDIDSERKLIFIKGAKGRKDRYTMLSESAYKTLRRYVEQYKPQRWLFPGPDKERHITVRTAQRIFEMACEKVSIKKGVTIHSLRHSFATHLLENGIDLRYIQEILGHKSSKTTEIYTHVSNKDLTRIKNPLDQIFKGKEE